MYSYPHNAKNKLKTQNTRPTWTYTRKVNLHSKRIKCQTETSLPRVSGDCSGNMYHPVSYECGPLLRDRLSSAVTATPHPAHGSGHLCVYLDRYHTNTHIHNLIHALAMRQWEQRIASVYLWITLPLMLIIPCIKLKSENLKQFILLTFLMW